MTSPHRAMRPCLLAICCLAGCQNTQPVQVTYDAPSLVAARHALDEGAANTSLAIARGVLAAEPRNVAALTQEGDAQAALGDRLDASASYRQALAIAPGAIGARLGLAKLKIRDDIRGAETDFRALLAYSPHNPIVLNDLGYVLDLQERHTEAQSCYEAAIAAAPDQIAPRVNLALSLALSGQPQRAESMLRDIEASSQGSRKAQLDYAVAQVMAGDSRGAAATLAAELPPQEAQSALQGMEQLRPAVTVK